MLKAVGILVEASTRSSPNNISSPKSVHVFSWTSLVYTDLTERSAGSAPLHGGMAESWSK